MGHFEAVSALMREGERADDLLNGYFLLQDPRTFCFGIDAVLLSHFPEIRKNDRILDLGCGSGVIPHLAAGIADQMFGADAGRITIEGLEIQAAEADRAQRSAAGNGLADRIRIRCGDMRRIRDLYKGNAFSLVYANPPYMAAGNGIPNPEDALALARHELTCTLEDAVRETARLLRNGGRTAWVYRPHRLTELFAVMRKYRLEPKRLKFVHPFADREANMVLIEASKGGGSFLKVEAPVIVFRAPGEYTPEIREVYGY